MAAPVDSRPAATQPGKPRGRQGGPLHGPYTGDITAHRSSIKGSMADVVGKLTDILGSQLVAYIGSVKETRAVRAWIAGTRVPRGEASRRLRFAYRVAQGIADADGIETAQAWFQGLNPLLGDMSPARLIRTGDLETDGPRIIAAEEHFLAG